MDDNRLTKKIFHINYRLFQNNWSSDIKTVMDTLGFRDNFTNKSIVDIQLARNKVNDHFTVMWQSTLQSYPELRTCKQFKQEFKIEQYVILNLSKNERSALAQLRCGILPLRIETGRYVNEPLHDIICTH
jgi:hypothetical protein